MRHYNYKQDIEITNVIFLKKKKKVCREENFRICIVHTHNAYRLFDNRRIKKKSRAEKIVDLFNRFYLQHGLWNISRKRSNIMKVVENKSFNLNKTYKI